MYKPSLRFPQYTEPYEESELSNYLVENKERNKSHFYSKDDVKSVSGEYGVVNQIEFLGKSMAGADVSNYHIVYNGDVVYTKSPLKASPYGIIKYNSGSDGIVSTLYAVYHCKDNAVPTYIDAYFSYESRLNRYLKPLVNIGAKHDMKVNNEDALSGLVSFPSIEEQKTISSFMLTYNKRISVQREKIATLESRKKGLLQDIFSQKIRFKADSGSAYPQWIATPLGNIFAERKSRSQGGETLLSVTISNGVIKQESSEKRNSSSEDKSNYKQVMKGDIAYNTMRMWQGAEGASEWDGIVSPAYTVITPITEVSLTFYEYLFKTPDALKLFTTYSQGLSSDNWNLKFEIFAGLKMNIPCIDEQNKIASFFKLLDKQIQVEKEKLEAMKLVKKGLLQQMFV